MKKLLMLVSLIAVAFGFSSCCGLSGVFASQGSGYRTESRQVRACGYDTITEEIYIPGSAKSGKGGMVQTVEKKVPRYKTVNKSVKIRCDRCVSMYCPTADCCGSTSDKILKMATIQGHVGSPNIGLMPTMTKLAP